ncbi:MAG: hypothetical protein Q9184_006323 [Pyrenodesmia sp. 2 TL-2023]
MTYPMLDAIDSLCQAAPHIITFEPAAAQRSSHNLYHRDVYNERRMLERSKKRHPTFTRALTKRTCRWCQLLIHPQPTDPEEKEARSLSESVKNNCLAAAYNVNASATHLMEAMKARRMMQIASADASMEREMESTIDCESVEYMDDAEISHVLEKNGITITTTAILPTPALSTTNTAIETSSTTSLPSQPRQLTEPHSRRASYCSSFIDDVQAFEKRGGGGGRGEEKTVLLMWGKGVDDEIEVPRRGWWRRMLGGRAKKCWWG